MTSLTITVVLTRVTFDIFSSTVYLLESKNVINLCPCVCFPVTCTDQVLEKAMHKCVLKPLKSVVEVVLHEFQVRVIVKQLLSSLHLVLCIFNLI